MICFNINNIPKLISVSTAILQAHAKLSAFGYENKEGRESNNHTKRSNWSPFKDDCAFSLLHQDFCQVSSLSTCCQNLEKKLGSPENLEENGGQTVKGSDREKCKV